MEVKMVAMVEKKKATRKQPTRQGRSLMAWVPDDLFEAFQTLIKKNRRKIRDELIIALENHLTAFGLWPPEKDTSRE
jgi:hypothetical protein